MPSCETDGHRWTESGWCVFCRTPRPQESLTSKKEVSVLDIRKNEDGDRWVLSVVHADGHRWPILNSVAPFEVRGAEPPNAWRSVVTDAPGEDGRVVLVYTGEAYSTEYAHEVNAADHYLWMEIPAVPAVTKDAGDQHTDSLIEKLESVVAGETDDGLWNLHGNDGMRYPEKSEVSGGQTDDERRCENCGADLHDGPCEDSGNKQVQYWTGEIDADIKF